ncbi:hypothetical protein ACWA2B_10590 [Paenibacillus sp. CMM36]
MIGSQPNSAKIYFEITYFNGEVKECPICNSSFEDVTLLLDKNWCCPDCGVKLHIKIECNGAKRVIQRLLEHELKPGMVLLRDRDYLVYELISILNYSKSKKLCLREFGSIDAQTNKYYNDVLGTWK